MKLNKKQTKLFTTWERADYCTQALLWYITKFTDEFNGFLIANVMYLKSGHWANYVCILKHLRVYRRSILVPPDGSLLIRGRRRAGSTSFHPRVRVVRPRVPRRAHKHLLLRREALGSL